MKRYRAHWYRRIIFPDLGVAASIGRTFLPEENRAPGGNPVLGDQPLILGAPVPPITGRPSPRSRSCRNPSIVAFPAEMFKRPMFSRRLNSASTAFFIASGEGGVPSGSENSKRSASLAAGIAARYTDRSNSVDISPTPATAQSWSSQGARSPAFTGAASCPNATLATKTKRNTRSGAAIAILLL